MVDSDASDVENLIEIYSRPDLYHNREDAEWFVKSFFDYHHIKVLKSDGNVVGALFWNVVEEKHHGLVQIVDLWIDEDFRKKGLGDRLLRAAIEDMTRYFAKGNCALRKVLVTTGEDNEPAKNLYQKNGFKKCALLKDLFRSGENEVVHILTVKP